MKPDNFVVIKRSRSNMHNFHIRKSILQSIESNLNLFEGKLLDSGCGKMPYKEYILKHSNVTDYVGLDIEDSLEYSTSVKPDHTWDGITMPFENNSFDCVIATEVLEHCPDPKVFLKEVFRVLKEGGVFFFTVPFLWNLHEVPNDEYRYTPFSMQRILSDQGFTNIKINASGGWHASMAQMIGLYVSRAPMNKFKRRLLKPLLYLPYKRLINKSKSENISFSEGQMITGLNGTCLKK